MRKNIGIISLLALCLVVAGCASNMGDDARMESAVSPQWPPAPQAARIVYLYSVSTPADMKIGRNWFGKAWQFIKGRQEARLARPQGIHVDPGGRLYVVDTGQRRIHVFDSKHSRYLWFPQEPIENFEFPVGVVADGNGRVYVSDAATHLIHVFDSFGKRHIASIGGNHLLRPTGLALRPGTADLLVVDTLASELLVFDTTDFTIKTRAGRNGNQQDALHYPTHIALAGNGDVFVTDSLNFRIQVLDSDLEFLNHFGDAGDGPGSFSRPKGVAIDSDENIYVVDALFDNVQIFNRNGELLLAFGTAGHSAGEFWLPSDIFIDSNDQIYVSDSYNSRVQVFRYNSQANQ